MSDVKAKFEAALAQRKKQKAEDASRGNFSSGSGYPDVPYAPLYTDKQQAFRLAGLPYLVREKPTDSKRVHIAMILGDDDKKFRCIGPDPQKRKDWFLYRFMNKVLTRHWDKNLPNSNGQLGAYVYDYASLHPELYNRVAKNNNVENTIEKGWRFTPYILFNVIDRANYEWHLENKNFRVLSKKASEWHDKVFFEPGVPDTVFQLIMDDIVAGDGNTDWEDYDIVIRKVNEKPWYKVLHGLDHIKYLDEDVKATIVDRGISDEERSWELNDFDRLFPVTRYGRIKSKLGLFIQKADQVLKTKYYEELLTMVEKEEAELAEQQMKFPPDEDAAPPDTAGTAGNSQTGSSVPSSADNPVQSADSLTQSPAPSAPPVRSPAPAAKVSTAMTEEIWAGLADGSYNGKHYLGVPLMTDKEKSFVLGVNEDGSFDWSPEAGELMEGQTSHFLSGANVAVDPLDGTRFDVS
jgi:hypothetical protein